MKQTAWIAFFTKRQPQHRVHKPKGHVVKRGPRKVAATGASFCPYICTFGDSRRELTTRFDIRMSYILEPKTEIGFDLTCWSWPWPRMSVDAGSYIQWGEAVHPKISRDPTNALTYSCVIYDVFIRPTHSFSHSFNHACSLPGKW